MGMTLKILKSRLVFFLTFFFLAASVHAEVGDKIVAVVNNEIITMFDLNKALESYQKRIESYTGTDKEALIAEAGGAMLNKLIDGLLIEQEAKRAGIVPKDEEVMNAIEDLFAKRNIKKEEFAEVLVREGSSFDAYKMEIRDQMIRVRVIRREDRK